jgi:hypothetical protein
MIHGGTDNPVNNLPLCVRSLTFASETQAVFRLGHWRLGPWSKVFHFLLCTTMAGLEILNSPLLFQALLVYISNKEGNQVSQFPPGNFPKLGDLLLDHRRDLDLRRKQQRRPSYRRWLPLLRAAAFLFYERWPSWSCKMVQTHCSVDSLEAHPSSCRSTLVAQNIMLKAQGRAAKSIWHSVATPSSRSIRQVCGLLPILTNSTRLFPHALWLCIIFFHVWVIVDLLYPIARIC